MIYLDTGAPTGGTSMFEAAGEQFQQFVEEAARRGGDGWRWPLPPAEMLGSFVSIDGIDEADLRWFYAKATPHPLGTLRQPLRLEHQGARPFGRTMIACTSGRDQPTVWAERARNVAGVGLRRDRDRPLADVLDPGAAGRGAAVGRRQRHCACRASLTCLLVDMQRGRPLAAPASWSLAGIARDPGQGRRANQ